MLHHISFIHLVSGLSYHNLSYNTLSYIYKMKRKKGEILTPPAKELL